MSRRSYRLESGGYYNLLGDPQVTYKETPYRTFGKRTHRRNGSICSSSRSIYPSDRSSVESFYIDMDRDSKRNMERGRTTTIFKFLLTVLCICSGITGLCYFATQCPCSSEATPSWPAVPFATVSNMLQNMVREYQKMAKQLKDLEMELLKVKKGMDQLHPFGNTLPNLALHSLNARVVDEQTSRTYPSTNWLTLFGIPVWKQTRNPNCIIKGLSDLVPGVCWPFDGERGHVVIDLYSPVAITHVSLGHISKTMSPTLTIESAPKRFTVYGMHTEHDEGTKLGTFLYDEDGDQQQTFKVPDDKSRAFKFVKLQVESNWGEPDYTCLYSFKVHGRQEKQIR